MEDLLGSAHTTHPASAVCLLIDTWDDPSVLPSAGHIHFPMEHSGGQALDSCMSFRQSDFGWHVFCSLTCWDGGKDKGIDGP